MNELFNQLMNFHDTKNDTPIDKINNDKKLKPSEKLIKGIESEGFDLSQLKDILKTRGNQQIVSAAGSGKTTALIFKVLYDIRTGWATKVISTDGSTVRVPDNIWVSTFLKSGAQELQSSFRKWEYKFGIPDVASSIQFSTLHAEFRRALSAMGIYTDIVDDTTNMKYLMHVIRRYHLKNKNGNNLSTEERDNLAGALTYTRNRLDKKRYRNQVYDDLGLTKAIVDGILYDWKAERLNDGKMDFEDMQERLYEECYVKQNADVINFLQNRYNLIYIDEFQDTSQLQYAVLKVYCAKAKQIVVIGDDDQTIYSWRGSDNSIITSKFAEDFNPVISKLSMNYRCPSDILHAIRPSIEKNKNRFSKNLESAKKGGVVRYGEYRSYRGMGEALSNLLYEDVKKGYTVAVLCRVNSDGILPAMFLDKYDKFTYSISGSGMTFDSYIGRLAIAILHLFTQRATTDVSRALKLLTWDEYSINKLMQVCNTNKYTIWTIPEEDLLYSCPSIADRLLIWRKFREQHGEVETAKLVLQDYKRSVFKKNTQFNAVMSSVLESLLIMFDMEDYDFVSDFINDIEYMNERLTGRIKKTGVQVQIATVHEFKGKEADSVYVWNDSEGVFPYKLSTRSDLDIEEERRIHYIANTRAKKQSTIMYLKGNEGRFVKEMNLDKAVKLTGNEDMRITGKVIGKKDEGEDVIKKLKEMNLHDQDSTDTDTSIEE